MMLTIDLSDKVALVTGGSRGIGGAITEYFCRAGATVVFTHTGNDDRRAEVDAFVGRLRDDGATVEAAAVDACDADEMRALVERLADSYGTIDILVHNVGRNIERKAHELEVEDWHSGLETNLGSAFYAVRAVLPTMLAAGAGRIVLVGSSAVYDGGGGAIEYAAAKAGMVGMMHYLNKTYARGGILTNTVHPCVIETELLKVRYADAEKKQGLIAQVPAGRLGRPEDIAGIVALLGSDHGGFICGQSILVDGGRTTYR